MGACQNCNSRYPELQIFPSMGFGGLPDDIAGILGGIGLVEKRARKYGKYADYSSPMETGKAAVDSDEIELPDMQEDPVLRKARRKNLKARDDHDLDNDYDGDGDDDGPELIKTRRKNLRPRDDDEDDDDNNDDEDEYDDALIKSVKTMLKSKSTRGRASKLGEFSISKPEPNFDDDFDDEIDDFKKKYNYDDDTY